MGTHGTAQGAWVPLRPQWRGVGSANRAVGLAKQRGSELERALGARGGCMVLGCTSVGTHGTAQGAWVPLRPQWGGVGSANRAVGPSKQRGSEIERALGARGGCMVLGCTHGGVKWLFGASGRDETNTAPSPCDWNGRGIPFGSFSPHWYTERVRVRYFVGTGGPSRTHGQLRRARVGAIG